MIRWLSLLLLSASAAGAQTAAPDLYSLELLGSPELQRFNGLAELRPAVSPFTVPVTAAGVHRYDVVITVDSLPDPASLGNYTTFIAWAAPPSLRPIVKLGVVQRVNTPQSLGELALNRFIIMVTAEADASVSEPTGPFVMRGLSPSMRLGGTHVVQARPPASEHVAHDTSGWQMPPAHPLASAMYMPALHGLTPNATPWLPAGDATTPRARPRSLLTLRDGDSLRLVAGKVTRIVRGKTVTLYGFNGEQPGPLLHVPQGAKVHVNFVNKTAHETAVHWHGVRLDNRFDGVPHLTQHPVLPGDSFRYQVKFPDAGVYWYHPHHREDIQQDLGLYGNMIVHEQSPNAYGRAHREEVVMLDDVLLGDDGLLAFGAERATHALMGRFGNVLLVNGEPAPGYRLSVRRGEVVRFFFTNVANTRTFNISIPGARLKVVGGDIGRYEREVWSESLVIAPAERYVVDVMFDSPGIVPIVNAVQAIDHTHGTFFPETDTLGVVSVSNEAATPDLARAFGALRRNGDISADVAKVSAHFNRPPDHTLTLTMKDRGLPFPLVQLLQRDTLFFNPVEWSGTMPMMDWLPTTDQVTWTLRDQVTGRENEDITWQFKIGDFVRIRLVNDRHTLHSMAHPIHIHGQRFLVLSVNGRATTNHVWKDTVLVPAGGIAELLLEITNPGMWMIHCHIAEHLEAGMKTVFGVSR